MDDVVPKRLVVVHGRWKKPVCKGTLDFKDLVHCNCSLGFCPANRLEPKDGQLLTQMLSTPIFEVVAYDKHEEVDWAIQSHVTRPASRFRVFESKAHATFCNAQRYAAGSSLAPWKTRHLVVTNSHEIFVSFETPRRFRHDIVLADFAREGRDSFVRETQWPRLAYP